MTNSTLIFAAYSKVIFFYKKTLYSTSLGAALKFRQKLEKMESETIIFSFDFDFQCKVEPIIYFLFESNTEPKKMKDGID